MITHAAFRRIDFSRSQGFIASILPTFLATGSQHYQREKSEGAPVDCGSHYLQAGGSHIWLKLARNQPSHKLAART
ncbi:hypothetical protein [Marinobacter sp.]|uniref:hypothetical protein n=1 Tax=Marinobacter sp. TaxID=50741 RepID=UPI003569EEFF